MKELNDAEMRELQEKLYQLRLEHRDLDDIVERLYEATYVDQLQISRIKRRKLQIKDSITRIESQLIPNLNA